TAIASICSRSRLEPARIPSWSRCTRKAAPASSGQRQQRKTRWSAEGGGGASQRDRRRRAHQHAGWLVISIVCQSVFAGFSGTRASKSVGGSDHEILTHDRIAR